MNGHLRRCRSASGAHVRVQYAPLRFSLRLASGAFLVGLGSRRDLQIIRGLQTIVVTGLLGFAAQQAGAFPGQTADELIQGLGLPANGYVSPPVPEIEAVRTGSAQLSRIYWPQATYDPLRSGASLNGIVVATFDYRGPGLVERVQKVPPDIGWKDLVSRSEVFLSFLPPQAFRRLLSGIETKWSVTAKAHHGTGVGYDLYSLTSKDGRLVGEMSFTDKGEFAPPPDAGGQQAPTLNFWTRISVVR